MSPLQRPKEAGLLPPGSFDTDVILMMSLLQCDKRHPGCLRCERLGRSCPGYDDEPKKRKREGDTPLSSSPIRSIVPKAIMDEIEDLEQASPTTTVPVPMPEHHLWLD